MHYQTYFHKSVSHCAVLFPIVQLHNAMLMPMCRCRRNTDSFPGTRAASRQKITGGCQKNAYMNTYINHSPRYHHDWRAFAIFPTIQKPPLECLKRKRTPEEYQQVQPFCARCSFPCICACWSFHCSTQEGLHEEEVTQPLTGFLWQGGQTDLQWISSMHCSPRASF